MAASQVSGMKMRTLLFGVILGLLAVVHSTPVNTVTQIPNTAEDEIIREAVTDGFLVENLFLPSGTTESPETNANVQASQRPTAESKESLAIEGSGRGASDEATTSMSLQFGTTTASHAPSAASTVLPTETGNASLVSSVTQSPPSISTSVPNEAHPSTTQSPLSISTSVPNEAHPSTTQSPPSISTSVPNEAQPSTTQSPPSISTSVPNEAQPSATPDHISASQTTEPAVSTFDFLSTQSSDSGSGDGEMFGQDSTTTTSSNVTSSSNAETSTASSTSTTTQKVPLLFPGNEGSGLGEEFVSKATTGKEKLQRMDEKPNQGYVYEPTSASSKAAGTPGWMIIVGFIVGLAALVMLFVAIATRDKWNGPSRASQLKDQTNSSNQQREMETFLQKDNPKENGHAGEYTVIPLEEMPENHSSH